MEKVPVDDSPGNAFHLAQQYEEHVEQQREILKYITDIGASLRVPMDIDTLLKRVSEAACKALRFRYSVLYLSDNAGYFRMHASSGISAEDEAYLQQHPLPDSIVAQLITERYRISDSYFIPAEAPLWQNEEVASFFVIVDEDNQGGSQPLSPGTASNHLHASSACWKPEDLMVVPLISADETLLGFLTPDAPLDGLRPTTETMALLELFANQAAVVIEGARLYEEARQSSEERAALIEIGRALSAPEALRDVQRVYSTIYEQVKRVMPADAFFVSRYYSTTGKLIIEYLVDEGKMYPPVEYPTIAPRTHYLLTKDAVGRLISTAEEYAQYTGRNFAEPDSGELGSGRISQSFLFAPICYGGEPIGMLSAQSYTPYAYTQRHLEMLKEIGVQAGIAITNARLYADLREALDQAQESEKLKNHFLMTASHELRTPLTAIQGYLELLGEFEATLDDVSKTRFINNARRACEELVLLLGNVMDASRIDQDRVMLKPRPVHLIEAIRVILEILEPIIAREGRTVEVNIADEYQVLVDDLRLRQILLNLVGNALKYTPASSDLAIHSESVCLDDLYRRLPATAIDQKTPNTISQITREFIVTAIRDWGPGIPLEDQPRLFTKFMRLTGAINSMQRGAGLGLYLCRQLAGAMGGYIWMESSGIPGEGATFFVALPRYGE